MPAETEPDSRCGIRCDADSPNECPWATDLLRYLVESGGYVHPQIVVRADRTVRIREAAAIIPRNTVLLTIPSSCCVTQDNCSKRFVSVVKEKTSELTMDTGDLLLAFHLATIADDSVLNRSPYARSFPPSTSYNSHPRRWSHAQQLSLLGGTSLLQKCREDAEALKRDYETVRACYIRRKAFGDTPSDSFPFPSYERFDDAFAAVSSRGFAGLGSDGSDAMVPLLDLLNHRRGTSTHSSTSNGKDVRYTYLPSKGSQSTSIEVVADRDLPAGTILHDTYGAKGNSQLLSRYGFCLETNWEPDGSCNDVVEFKVKVQQPYGDVSTTVKLRAGPKSYTYGGFVKALECFLFDDQEQEDGEDDEDGMEAFLDEEEEEEGFGMMYGTMDNEMEDDNNDTAVECAALEKLSASLETARQGYTLQGPALQNALTTNDCSPEHCAALLISSERRTLLLFKLAAVAIRRQLRGEEIDMGAYKGLDVDDTLVSQMEELVTAYGAIRHDGF